MPQLTSVQTKSIPAAPAASREAAACKRAARVRVGSACDRAQLEQANRQCLDHVTAVKRACLYAVLAMCHGDSLQASAERFGVCAAELQQCCDIINDAGAQPFLTMLAAPQRAWHVPTLHLPKYRRRRCSAGLMPARPAPPTPPPESPQSSPRLSPTPTPPLMLPDSGTPPLEAPAICDAPCTIEAEAPAQELEQQAHMQAACAAIEAFAAQDSELFAPRYNQAPLSHAALYASLPTLDMLQEEPALWLHAPTQWM